MLTLTKVLLAMMAGFVASVLFGWVIVPFLKKIKFRQRISIFVGENHQKKSGTPTI